MKEKMTESKKNSGVDPKSYGAFDKFMDKVSNSKVAKGLGLGAALSMAANSDVAKVSQPVAEVAYLPSGHGEMTEFNENNIVKVGTSLGSGIVSSEQVFDKDNIDWVDNLLKNLSENYFCKSSTDIWYRDPESKRETPVLIDMSFGTAIFQFDDKKRDSNGVRVENGRETIRFVDSEHIYIFPDSTLVVVSNYDKRVFTFDEVSKKWVENLGNEVIAGYVNGVDGSKEVIVWRKNVTEEERNNFSEVGDNGTGPSGYRIDYSGALVSNSGK